MQGYGASLATVGNTPIQLMLGKMNRLLMQISNGIKSDSTGLNRRDVALLNSTLGACEKSMSAIGSTYGSQVN